MLDALVVGAGISGLSLGRTLQQQQHSLLVAERQPQVGGNITTSSTGEFLWEEGPNSFSPARELLELAVDAGLREELVLADRQLPRYIYWRGRLQPVPMRPSAALKTQLLSPSGKLRALAGALGFVPPAVGEAVSQQGGEETVAQFFQRHLGREVTERLVAPFVSGVYAGDVRQLSAQAAFRRVTQLADRGGGLLPGALLGRQAAPQRPATSQTQLPQTQSGELGSFRTGLQALPNAIAERLGDALRCNWALSQLQRTERDSYLATFQTPQGPQQVEARAVVLTTPAYTSAELLRPLHARASQRLAAIPYPPVASVVLAYPQQALGGALRGFGNLNPRGQGIRTLGTIWSSALFAGRAPAGWEILTSFIGGATDPEIARLDEDRIVQAVHADLRQVLLARYVAPKVLAVRLWHRAIPQYAIGHQAQMQALEAELAELPGLFLCSNYLDGVSLGDCIRRGFERAHTVSHYLQAPAAAPAA
ncbi:MAG: protoporphyrinogen oxidase [Cyanobacteria bacterium QS_8_64_29]|nr:MAG: protoporphyrinogen oxidase [Cyanobacteria bacterium QS_8_64_29]